MLGFWVESAQLGSIAWASEGAGHCEGRLGKLEPTRE